MAQGFQSGYPPSNGVGSNHNSNSAEQAQVVELLLQMPYLVMVQWIVTRGRATGEWLMPPVGQTEQMAEMEQGGATVPGSNRAEQREGKPSGRISQPPVILAWDEQPQTEGVEQFLKGRELTLRNTPSSPAFQTSTSYQHFPKFQAYQNLASSTVTSVNNPVRERSMAAAVRKSTATGYPYRYSPYFKSAEKLIQKQATGLIPADLLVDCKLVLTLIVAWCNYSLFNSEGSSRKGEWMTLSRVKMARELGKQDARIGECLHELARVGLISYGLAGEEFGVIGSEEFDWLAYDCKYLPRLQGSVAANWWGARSCQKKRTLFYRLLVMPEEVLPVFEPFGNGNSAGSTNGQEQHFGRVSGNDLRKAEMTGSVVANGGNDQISRVWNDPGRKVRPVQNELELHRKDVGITRNDLNRQRMTSERQENDQQVVPVSFRGASHNSLCSNVLNDDDDVDDEEVNMTRLREYNSGTIKAKTTQSPHQSSITGPVTFKDNLSQAQSQDRQQEEWHKDEKEQREGQEGAEEPASEEVVSGSENDKATHSERPRPNRLQEEIAALRRSPAHWAKFEYLTGQVSFAGFEKDGKTRLDESQCVRLAASDTTSLELLRERHAQVLEMWEQGRCYSPLGLFYTAVRDNYDPRSEGTVSEEVELEQVVRRATRLIQHQSQQGEEEGSGDGEVASNSAPGEGTCFENGQGSSKETYPTTKVTSTRTSSTSTQTSQFSFRKPDYSSQPHQSYYHNNNSSHYGSRSRNKGSGWQSGGYSRYRPSHQPWSRSNSAGEEEEVAAVYDVEEEERSTQTEEMYPPQPSVQEIDPVLALERICNWLESILRKPDLARKLAGARLELGKDQDGKNKATFWLNDERFDPTSFSREEKALIRIAFSTEVAPHYKLQLSNGEVVVTLE
jgi:hypothetical protein